MLAHDAEAGVPARAQHQLFRAKELLTHLAEAIGLAGGGAAAPQEAGAMSAQECGALARDLLVLILECLGAPQQLLRFFQSDVEGCNNAPVL